MRGQHESTADVVGAAGIGPLVRRRKRALDRTTGGITDDAVTTLSKELDRDVTVAEVLPVVEVRLGRIVSW